MSWKENIIMIGDLSKLLANQIVVLLIAWAVSSPAMTGASVRYSAKESLLCPSSTPVCFLLRDGNMTKMRLPLLHESSEQSCNSAPLQTAFV